ncbi:MAG: RDD family protein [Proteobacteria bacterium]|nr:RDD family protein [Pseudomonadota bacterium]
MLAGRAASLPSAASDAASQALAAASAALSDPERRREQHAAQRIARLEAEIAELRKPRVVRWRDDAVKAIHSVGLGFGWAAAYFTLLPLWWNGQTLGKKMFGLRVVPLAGNAMGPLGWFGRYGGYAAGMATGGVGFAQVLWDPNRQAIQDKIAHTVVIDLKAPRRTAQAMEPAAIGAVADAATPAVDAAQKL